MFMFDVETLGKESRAVILSMACTHFDENSKPSPEGLRDSTFFVKLDAADQVNRLNRCMTRSSLDWWSKQCMNVKRKSFIPSKQYDIKLEDGIERMRIWASQFNETKSWVWARGNLDQLVLDSLEEQLHIEPVFSYNRWRDVRTAIDLLYDTENGYCDVEYPGFDPQLHITKHDPVDDCVYDIMMLLYGKKWNEK